jgi:hypothetical protein
VDSAIRAGLLGLLFGLIISPLFFALQHTSSVHWALVAVWDNVGSIVAYSFLAALVFAVVGAPIGVITNWRRSGNT